MDLEELTKEELLGYIENMREYVDTLEDGLVRFAGNVKETSDYSQCPQHLWPNAKIRCLDFRTCEECWQYAFKELKGSIALWAEVNR